MNNYLLFLVIIIFSVSPIYGNILDIAPTSFNFTLGINETKEASFRLVHTNESINLTTPIQIYYTSILPMKISKTNFTIHTAENIYFNITVEAKNYPTGTYTSHLYVQSQGEIHHLPIYTYINETKLYSFQNQSKYTLNQSTYGIIYVPVKNEGNNNLNLNINTSGIFKTVPSINLPAGIELKVPIFYEVPVDFPSGEHIFNLDIGNKSQIMNVTIIDQIAPTMHINVSNEGFFGENLPINASCEDNENISQFYYIHENISYNISEEAHHNFFKTGLNTLSFYCIDNYNNSIIVDKEILINQVQIHNISQDIIVNSKKPQESIFINLFSVLGKTEAKIRLENFTYSGDNMELIIVSGDSSKLLANNVSVDFPLQGKIVLALKKFDVEDRYSGNLRFNFDENCKKSEIIIPFEGRIASYSVPDMQNVSIFGEEITCKGVDRGTSSDSTLTCSFEYPINTNLEEDLTYHMTKYQLDLLENNWQNKYDEQEKDHKWYNIFLYIIIIALVLFIVIFFILPKVLSQYA